MRSHLTIQLTGANVQQGRSAATASCLLKRNLCLETVADGILNDLFLFFREIKA